MQPTIQLISPDGHRLCDLSAFYWPHLSRFAIIVPHSSLATWIVDFAKNDQPQETRLPGDEEQKAGKKRDSPLRFIDTAAIHPSIWRPTTRAFQAVATRTCTQSPVVFFHSIYLGSTYIICTSFSWFLLTAALEIVQIDSSTWKIHPRPRILLIFLTQILCSSLGIGNGSSRVRIRRNTLLDWMEPTSSDRSGATKRAIDRSTTLTRFAAADNINCIPLYYEYTKPGKSVKQSPCSLLLSCSYSSPTAAAAVSCKSPHLNISP